jgi:hypothetical protein
VGISLIFFGGEGILSFQKKTGEEWADTNLDVEVLLKFTRGCQE